MGKSWGTVLPLLLKLGSPAGSIAASCAAASGTGSACVTAVTVLVFSCASLGIILAFRENL